MRESGISINFTKGVLFFTEEAMIQRFEQFVISVVELNRSLQRIKEQEMKRFGLHATHTMCLYYLGQYPKGRNFKELTELTREDKASVSRTLARLEQMELIRKETPEQKRAYRVNYVLTTQGQQLVEKINERIKTAVFNGGSGLSDEERDVFYHSMQRILDNLAKYTGQEKEKSGKEL